MPDPAERLLRDMLGPAATFREGQREAVNAIVRDRARVLVVQKTGWGKSLVYFVATRLLRDKGAGPTLLISPLLSLMRNQIEMATRIGVRAHSINSANADEWPAVEHALAHDAGDILLISPERLASREFVSETLPRIQRNIGLFVVDEAHCISDWGHDFRPDYRRIVRVLRNLPPSVPVLATTATANDRVVRDVAEQLAGERPPKRRLPWWLGSRPGEPAPAPLTVQRGPLARPSLRLQVLQLGGQAERLAWLAANVPALPGAGIIYCLTVGDCLRVSDWLALHGVDAPAYHARLPGAVRAELEQRLLRNEVKALVATVALGMGFDKPDLGFVVHFQRPGSVVAYYQQIGRAGRALDDAHAVLLSGAEDDDIIEYFIAAAFPGIEFMRQIVAVVEARQEVTFEQILPHVNLPAGRIQQCLTLLEIDGALGREGLAGRAGTRYWRTVNPWQPDEEGWRRVTATRYHELERMRTFVGLQSCLMEFIARELDDPAAAPCGRCAVCAGPVFAETVSPVLLAEAVAFLRRDALPIPPRRRWPAGMLTRLDGVALNPVNAEGRALSEYGDAGWGQEVHTGKYRDGRFSDVLVWAAAALIADAWRPQPPPAWVTAIPSLRHPELVPDFAQRLADALALPFRPALVKRRETPPQKTMQNSAHQLRNVLDAFAVATSNISSGPVLLVDDIVDSRWTLTFCGALLRAAGVGVVYPFALASATGARRPP
jgi:ATP-dependent DNA helicase RecQ